MGLWKAGGSIHKCSFWATMYFLWFWRKFCSIYVLIVCFRDDCFIRYTVSHLEERSFIEANLMQISTNWGFFNFPLREEILAPQCSSKESSWFNKSFKVPYLCQVVFTFIKMKVFCNTKNTMAISNHCQFFSRRLNPQIFLRQLADPILILSILLIIPYFVP